MSKHNDMPVHYDYAYTKNASEKARENGVTYDALCTACEFGTAPDGVHTIIQRGDLSYARHTYYVIDNPIGLDAAHIALFCDEGNLCFGYSAAGNRIDIYTD